jgi:hypothetical protein
MNWRSYPGLSRRSCQEAALCAVLLLVSSIVSVFVSERTAYISIFTRAEVIGSGRPGPSRRRSAKASYQRHKAIEGTSAAVPTDLGTNFAAPCEMS